MHECVHSRQVIAVSTNMGLTEKSEIHMRQEGEQVKKTLTNLDLHRRNLAPFGRTAVTRGESSRAKVILATSKKSTGGKV